MDTDTVNAQLQMLKARLDVVCVELQKAEQARCDTHGYTLTDKWHWTERTKYIAIDCGSSGAFLVEKSTGELFNIKGYGTPDLNKKRKANIGNIFTVDPSRLHGLRHNYLR